MAELNTSIGGSSKGLEDSKCRGGSKHMESSKSLDSLKDSSKCMDRLDLESSECMDGLKDLESSKCMDGLKDLESSKCMDGLKDLESSKCIDGLKDLESSKCPRNSAVVSATSSSAAPDKRVRDTNSEKSGVPLAIDQPPEDKGGHQTTSKDSLTDDDKDFKPATKRYRQLSPERVSRLHLYLWTLNFCGCV